MDQEGESVRVDSKSSGRDGATDEGFVDPFAPIVSEAEKRGLTREQAIEIGARLGADTADKRGEAGELRSDRIARAMAYAAWDFDGRPTTSTATKVPPLPDFKKERKEK